MNKPEVLMFRNGNVAVFIDGKQVDTLQAKGWLGTWLESVEAAGYNPEGWTIGLPCGGYAKVHRTSDPDAINKWTWEIL